MPEPPRQSGRHAARRSSLRRGTAALAGLALVGSGLVGGLITAPEAEARYATGGTGAYLGAIDWFEWGEHNEVIPSEGTTRTNTRTIAGQEISTTCTIGE